MSDEAILESDNEDYEAYDEDYGEAFRLPRIFPFRTNTRRGGTSSASGTSNYAPPPAATTPFVTQAVFSRVMKDVAKDMKANSAAISSMGSRVGAVESVNAQQSRELAKQAKFNQRQEKEIAGVRKDLKKTNDNSLLLTLLSKPKTLPPVTAANATVGGAPVPVGTKLQYTTGNDNSLLLALLLTGGLGSSGGDDSSNSLFLALALSGGL